MLLYTTNGVYRDDQAMVTAFLGRDYLREHLECGHSITKEYRNDHGVWGEMKLIRISEDSILGGTTLTNPQRLPNVDKLRVRCFGSFDVFFHGEPLIFRRSRTKELLAYLVDYGGVCAAGEIIDALWEEGGAVKNPKPYLRALTKDLYDTLASVGMEEVLIREHNQWAIRKELLDCDYYRLLDGDAEAAGDYYGEYVDIDDGIVFDFDEVHCFRHFRMLGLERRQRRKIIHPVDSEDHAYVLPLIGLAGSLVVKQVRCESSEVIHIFGIDFI